MRVTLVVDPRFPGGTAAAVAAEIGVLAPLVDLEVVAIESRMLQGRTINPRLRDALETWGIEPRWAPPVARGDVVVLHNPACLKFDTDPPLRVSCDTAIVVTHENLLRPGGAEAFDVAHCLALIDRGRVSGRRLLAPVSPANRDAAADWLASSGSDWELAPFDWFNIVDMPMRPPTKTPRDRRGRHSRPGFEKFPGLEAMRRHFSPRAERVVLLGADHLVDEEGVPSDWDLRRFGETDVDRFLSEIDFFVYFTNPLWRESFGRVVAEAIAAGKLVITDPATASSFGPAVVASTGDDVDEVVGRFIADPDAYVAFVLAAQRWLTRFSPERFAASTLGGIRQLLGGDHASV
jgi:hypothetical protein